MTSHPTAIRSDESVFDEVETWWNEQTGPRSTPFLRSEWFKLWSKCFSPRGSRLEVVVLDDADGDPIAALPLFRIGLRRYSLSNSHSDLFDLVGDPPDDDLSIVHRWLDQKPMTRLYRLDRESSLNRAARAHGWIVDGRADSPFIDLSHGSEEMLARLKRSHVNDIRRCEKRLSELGEVVFFDNAAPEIPGILERCLELEASGWKGEAGSAIASRSETLEFYRGLVDLAAAHDWLSLSVLFVAERLAAFQLNLDYAGRRFLLKIGYDESLRAQSPGKVLQSRVVSAAADKGLLSHELGGEAEDWKLSWADQSRNRVSTLRFGNLGWARWIGTPLRWKAELRARAVDRRQEPMSDADR